MSYYQAWQTTGLQLPSQPDAMRDWTKHFTLQRQEDYLINGKVKKLAMGLGWDAGCDVDGSVALFDANCHAAEVVWWENLAAYGGAVKHSGDDRTGEGGGDDEVITVKLEDLPNKIHHLLFIVCVYTPGMSFNQVRSAYVRMISKQKSHSNHELARYQLSHLQGNALLMGLLSRKGAYWNFTALGTPAEGNTVMHVIKDPSVAAILQRSKTSNPRAKKISISVIKGRNLAAKDKAGVFSRKKGTSDPYVQIKYKDHKLKSHVVEKNLNPTWNMKALDLGKVLESESKAVKITVWDYDKMSGKDFMGAIRIPAAGLFNASPGTHEWWIPLTNGKKSKYAKAEVSGDILVECNIKELDKKPTTPDPYGAPQNVMNPSAAPTPQGASSAAPAMPWGGAAAQQGGYPGAQGYPGGAAMQQQSYPGGPPIQQGIHPGGPQVQQGGYPGGPPAQQGGYPGGPPAQLGGYPVGPPAQQGAYPGGPPQQGMFPGGPPMQQGGYPMGFLMQQGGYPAGPPVREGEHPTGVPVQQGQDSQQGGQQAQPTGYPGGYPTGVPVQQGQDSQQGGQQAPPTGYPGAGQGQQQQQ